MNLTPAEITALNIVGAHPRAMLPRAHVILNANIGALLRAGLVAYAPRKASAYALTASGRAARLAAS